MLPCVAAALAVLHPTVNQTRVEVVTSNKDSCVLLVGVSWGLEVRWVAGSCFDCGVPPDATVVNDNPIVANLVADLSAARQGASVVTQVRNIHSIVASGWPITCFAFERQRSGSIVGAIPVKPRHVILSWGDLRTRVAIDGLPVVPYWMRYLVNVLVFVLIVALCQYAIGVGAAYWRWCHSELIRVCPNCGYALMARSGYDLCSECGFRICKDAAGD